MANHPPSTHSDFVKGHRFAQIPEWVDSNGIWDAYVAAGGTTLADSYGFPFSRSDIAWVWNKFIRHSGGDTVAALAGRVKALEDAPGGGAPIDVEAIIAAAVKASVAETIKRLGNG